jgi:hypothetical protein
MLRLFSSAFGWISVHVEDELDGDIGRKYRQGLGAWENGAGGGRGWSSGIRVEDW